MYEFDGKMSTSIEGAIALKLEMFISIDLLPMIFFQLKCIISVS